MTRERLFRWIVRAVFWCGLAYLYLAVYRQAAFRPYRFLLENLFLAYVPIELSFHLEETTRRAVFWPVFAVWFFFYPNAPYMLTDFFHLALRNPYIVRADGTRTGLLLPDMKMWLMFLNLAACALVSTFVGILTLHRTVSVLLRRMGRTETELWYEPVDFSKVQVLILEWTHGNNDLLRGVDIPVFLGSTPAETLAHRIRRNRDGNPDSPFVTKVLEMEQGLLTSQGGRAAFIISRSFLNNVKYVFFNKT